MSRLVISLISVCLLLIAELGNAQDCSNLSLRFGSQEEINNFDVDGFACTEVAGVQIGSAGYDPETNTWFRVDDITNLDGLEGLDIRTGRLSIYGTVLTSLSIPNGQIRVLRNDNPNRSFVEIQGSPTFADLTGLDGAINYWFQDLPSLVSLAIFDSFPPIYRLNLTNTGIVNLEGLEEQTEILYFTLGGNLALESLDGFPEGMGPMDVLSIADHPVLDNIRGLAGLETISIGLPEGQLACNSNLAIVRNDALESLDGLQNLRDVRGVLGIAGNQSLNDISALRNVERVTGINCVQLGLALSDNPSLSNCSVLAPLLGYPDANDLTSALAYGSVGVAIDIGSEGNPESFSGIGMPNGEGANSVKECIDAYAAVLPEVLIEELIAYVADLNTSNGISNALDAKLSVVERALGDANESNDVAALNAMYAFCDNAEAQRGKKLASEDVDELLASANRVIQAVDPYAALCTD